MTKSDKYTLKSFLYRHLYLLVIAAWLVTIGIIVDTYYSKNATVKDVHRTVQHIVQQQENAIQQIFSDTAFVNRLANNTFSEKELKELKENPFSLYVYRGDSVLTFWSSNTVVPNAALIYLNGKAGFVQLANGFYVWNKQFSGNNLVVALIPVKWNYIVTNEYLVNKFAFKPSLLEEYTISVNPDDGNPVVSVYGNRLFFVEQLYTKGINLNNPVSVALMIVAFFIVVYFLQLLASFIAARSVPVFGILFFSALLILLRVFSYEHAPVNLRQFELFDPAIYGSSFILRSLGDLLINVVLALWIALFIRNTLVNYNVHFSFYAWWKKMLIGITGSVIMLTAVYVGTGIIKSLVSDSQISFDVMDFFSLNMYSVVGFIILTCVAITFYLIGQLVSRLIFPLTGHWVIYLTILITGLIYLSFRIGKLDGGIDLYVLLWLALFMYLLNNRHFIFESKKLVSSQLIFWLIIFSASITSLIILQNRNKELQSRKYYAEALAAKADPASETLINTMLTDFREDFLADNFDKLSTSYLSKAFKDSLLENNVSGYTDRYDTRIFTYDKDEQPLYNFDSTTYNDLNTIFETQAKPTGISNLYYYDQSYDKFSYISKKVLRNLQGDLLGYVFVLSSLKEDNNDAVYPELFNRGQANSLENSSRYAFAIYNNGKLINSYNDYPFATTVNTDEYNVRNYSERERNGYHELWYNAGAGRLVVIVNENKILLESITLFSYFFCAFLIITSVIWIFNALLTSRFRLKAFKAYWQLTLRSQIHGTIIFICVLSFLVIGAASILFFINRYHNNNREMLSRVISIMENELKVYAQSDTLITNQPGMHLLTGNDVEQVIRRVSEVHGTDVNLYDLDGELITSSLPLPYTKGILSTYMEPVAFYHMDINNEVQYFQQEHIGELSYISNYKPVIDNEGNKVAYLNIPYFISETNLKEEISNFLVTIINLNAFIFLIAGIVAFYIANRITATFSVISEKMKLINLDRENEPIEWTRDDEIGQLVREFNTMLAKLDASADALAKTEREGAWREMARQIAHEIKNPLTPMKLSMQYLQKAMGKEKEDVQQLTNNVVKTMVEQIDHLSQIAGEFNQFANIEHSNKQLIDLNEVLRSVIYLFETDSSLDIQYTLYKEVIRIEADKSHINRIFTNLIKNAIQAVPEDRKASIRITQVLHGNEIIVSVRDNGSGIPEEFQKNIFMPNFTTKTSGTGLGLAMCKRMVEHAGGQIRFETDNVSGTIFYVSLPVVT